MNPIRSYSTLYDKILTGTMSYVDTENVLRFKIKNPDIKGKDLIYASAVKSSAPITLVYTPAGSGKSNLVKDRVNALKSIGIRGDEIIVLNMNISKSKQMSKELIDTNVMTFSDFTHNIFTANYPNCKLSDITSIINTLRLQPQNNMLSDFINKLSMVNQQDRATVLTLYTNANLDFVTNTLLSIGKADYSLESMICQNRIYTFANNPYNAKAIIINGVQNMPIPILCAILAYVNRYHCNLFITGSPEETIYDFNAAYNNAMNVMSSYAESKNIDIIRLSNTSIISDDIKAVLNMKQNAVLSNIFAMDMVVNHNTPLQSIVRTAFGPKSDYLKTRINNKEPVLIIARSRNDLAEIKQVIKDYYLPLYPDLNILDLTTIQPTTTTYGEIASKYYNSIRIKFPNGITTIQFFSELYNCMAYEISVTGVPSSKNQCITDKDNIMSFFTKNRNKFPDDNIITDVKTMIQTLIDTESEIIQNHMLDIQNNATMDMDGADIILSTIHTAIDIRNDHVMIFFRNFNENIDNSIYKVALSRANKSEYIISVNYGPFETPYQLYLKSHLTRLV